MAKTIFMLRPPRSQDMSALRRRPQPKSDQLPTRVRDPLENVAVSTLGRTPEGRSVERYTLRNAQGLEAEVMTYGATLMALRTPDRHGRFENIVLGFDTLEPYLAGTPYIGATVGRYANRIAGARFELDGVEYRLTANEGRNQLHGGARGFDKVVWHAQPVAGGVQLSHVSADGAEGYPGELTVEVTFRLADGQLAIDYLARTTKPTHVNLTHHSYFNLSGNVLREIRGQALTIEADRYTPVDADLIPTGELRAVDGAPFDFRTPHAIGERIDDNDAQIRISSGYDHNFVLNKIAPGPLTRAAFLSDPESGRTMELWTTEPGLQFYTGNGLEGVFTRRTGLCLEPQHFPNSPNEPRFPSTLLRPSEEYRSRTEFRFGVTG
jgi:aldose 1-epimerase